MSTITHIISCFTTVVFIAWILTLLFILIIFKYTRLSLPKLSLTHTLYKMHLGPWYTPTHAQTDREVCAPSSKHKDSTSMRVDQAVVTMMPDSYWRVQPQHNTTSSVPVHHEQVILNKLTYDILPNNLFPPGYLEKYAFLYFAPSGSFQK